MFSTADVVLRCKPQNVQRKSCCPPDLEPCHVSFPLCEHHSPELSFTVFRPTSLDLQSEIAIIHTSFLSVRCRCGSFQTFRGLKIDPYIYIYVLYVYMYVCIYIYTCYIYTHNMRSDPYSRASGAPKMGPLVHGKSHVAYITCEL